MSKKKDGDKFSGSKRSAERHSATLGDSLSAEAHEILQGLKRQLVSKPDGVNADSLGDANNPMVQSRAGGPESAQINDSVNRKSRRKHNAGFSRQQRMASRQRDSVNHGNLSVYRFKQKVGAAAPALIAKLVLPNSFRQNPALIKGPESNSKLLKLTHDGIADPNSSGASEDVDLVLGVDFGTSFIKIVIGDNAAKRRFLVEFNESFDERFFLRSRLFERDGEFSLNHVGDSGAVEVRDIKLNLIRKDPRPTDQDFDYACGLLALAIRRARAWFFDKHLNDYRDPRFNWSLNVGLPASSYEDAELTERMRRISWAAANLAADPAHREITRRNVEAYRAQSHLVYAGPTPSDLRQVFHSDLVNVVPEIAAEIFGFVNSAQFDPLRVSCVAMYDVGAGTADTALVGITPAKGSKKTFSFYGSDVQSLGVINFHKSRILWLQEQLSQQSPPYLPAAISYLEAVAKSTYSLDRIPEKVEDYLSDSIVENDSADNFVDLIFRRKIQNQFLDCVYAAMRRHGVGAARSGEVPFFLCGGGSRHPVYQQIVKIFNKNQNGVRLSIERLPLPEGFVAPGLPKDDFDRVAVAYGLSSESVANIIREKQIPTFERVPQAERDRNFISKDQV